MLVFLIVEHDCMSILLQNKNIKRLQGPTRVRHKTHQRPWPRIQVIQTLQNSSTGKLESGWLILEYKLIPWYWQASTKYFVANVLCMTKCLRPQVTSASASGFFELFLTLFDSFLTGRSNTFYAFFVVIFQLSFYPWLQSHCFFFF